MTTNNNTTERSNRYNVKKLEDSNETSYRIPIDYTRAGIMEEIVDSFALLWSKGRSKTRFIVDSVEWSKKHPKLSGLDEAIFEARKLEYCKSIYGLESIEDFIRFFEDKKSREILETRLEPYRHTPAKMTLGFDRTSDAAGRVFDMLGQEAPRERVTIISKAVLDYVKAGNDSRGDALFANKYLYNLMNAYNAFNEEEDRKDFLETLEILMEQSTKLLRIEKSKEEVEKTTKNITNEVRDLLGI